MKNYFAYGSNMDSGQMANRCPRATRAGVARLEGYRFRINARGVATVVPDPTGVVWGVLWQITEADEARLDSHEDVPGGVYTKASVKIVSDGATEPTSALTYLATNTRPGTPRPLYLERVLGAASEAGLPTEYQAELREWATLLRRFDEEMMRLYREPARQLGYPGNYYLQMLQEDGSYVTAVRLAGSPKHHDGLTWLHEHDGLEWSVEATVRTPPWRWLFDPEVVATATKKLRALGFVGV